MKALKYFGMLFVYPVLLLGTGFLGGAAFVSYFYPGGFQMQIKQESIPNTENQTIESSENSNMLEENDISGWQRVSGEVTQDTWQDTSDEEVTGGSAEVLFQEEVLNADTSYVLEETDLRSDSVVETTWKLPAKYIGMNREEFLEAMEIYEASPPLEELERGFVSLEVLSFSTGKVVVQMNYEYVQPGNSFYVTVEDNYVVVYLEDKQTVYMDTDILLKDLPEELQFEIIQMMYIPDEETLFNFLENYSS